MLGNYVGVDKKRVILGENIIAILTGRDSAFKSKVILKEGFYNSKTSPRKIAERLQRGKI